MDNSLDMGHVNLLTREMQEHLHLDGIIYEVTDSMSPIFVGDRDGSSVFREPPLSLAIELLKTACKVYTQLNSLRIDPGRVDPEDHYYTMDMSGSYSVYMLLRDPRVVVHMVNCTCVLEFMFERLSDERSSKGKKGCIQDRVSDVMHMLTSEFDSHGGPIKGYSSGGAYSASVECTEKVFAKNLASTTELCTCQSNCLYSTSRENMKILVKRIVDINTGATLLSNPNMDLSYMSDENAICSSSTIRGFYRLISIGIDPHSILQYFGWTPYDETLSYANWCNCPCDGKSYDPNRLDVAVVESYLLKLSDAASINSMVQSLKDRLSFMPITDLKLMLQRLHMVRMMCIRNMIYRILNRCRRLYVNITSKVRCLIRIQWIYLHGCEPASCHFLEEHNERTDASTLREMLNYFNYSFLHHIVPFGEDCE